MRTFEHIEHWIQERETLRGQAVRLGFVPTMGALHKGHLSLVEQAKEENDLVLVSIFINPTQFNNAEDLSLYPRQVQQDLSLLESIDTDFVLLPQTENVYQDQYRYKVTETETSRILCGKHRPGHFDGVLTVVAKLLGIAQADRCYMGEKDYQQFKLVKDMTESLFFRTNIIPCPIVREENGLAMSSRNQRLSPDGFEKAALIFKFLSEKKSCEETKAALEKSGFNVEYVEEHWGRRFVAAWIEGVRLIDNVKI